MSDLEKAPKTPLLKQVEAANRRKKEESGSAMKETTFYSLMDQLKGCAPEYRPTVQLVELAKERLNMKFGEQLQTYLLRYGCLFIGNRLLQGLNTMFNEDSDLVVNTLCGRETIPEIDKMALIDVSLGNWIFAVDEKDGMYVYSREDGLVSMDMKLFDFLLEEYHRVPPLKRSQIGNGNDKSER